MQSSLTIISTFYSKHAWVRTAGMDFPALPAGCVVQWLNVGSLVGELPLSCAGLAAEGLTTIVDKPSATGQPTKPAQPFMLSGSINPVPALTGRGKGGNVTSAEWQV